MDRLRKKKDKPQKHVDKDSPSSFISDVKAIKEHLKIKELLRTVKMNSSMRVKAPRGSKVMNNKDFNDNDDLFSEGSRNDCLHGQATEELTSATNSEVIIPPDKIDLEGCSDCSANNAVISNEINEIHTDTEYLTKNNSAEESSTDVDNSERIKNLASVSQSSELPFVVERPHVRDRERKLSLDQSMLRREMFSQSEIDLNSIGKSPLERKSSFFRKKMDSFLKNTTEIFKRQSSSGSRPEPVQRRGSMSASLHSLHSLHSLNENPQHHSSAVLNKSQGSSRSLQSSSTLGRSTSSLSASQTEGRAPPSETEAEVVDADSLASSQPLLSTSQTIDELNSHSAHSLNAASAQDSLLSARAISMSSGLDTAHNSRRRKSSNRSNRVTWVASEGLAHYFRRLIQDENSSDMQVCHSYTDFTTIPENELCGPRAPRASQKGRRLSYQRAVSGEDPVLGPRHDNTQRRRQPIQENSEATHELASLLAEFTKHGVPPLQGFAIAGISDEALAYLLWAEQPDHLEEYYDLKKLPPYEENRQAVIREMVCTEAVHIKHLKSIVEVFIAAAHALQDAGKLLDIDTEKLFSNIPDVLNASLTFWEAAMYPMLADALANCGPFNTDLMSEGFCRFREIFLPYEKFVSQQTRALDYLRSLAGHAHFMMYLTWCHSHNECNRLQLSDILVKPFQRLTKYSLILRRIIMNTDTEPERTALCVMENHAKNYVLDLNRSIRQREELEKLDALANSIEGYEVDFKDEDLDRYFRMFSQLNLKAPMVGCVPTHSRSIIYQGDVRYKDKEKEMEVRAILLTDMLLITKKQKGATYPFKLIRPKFMIDKLMFFPKIHQKNPKEILGLVFVVLDDVGSSFNAFILSETQKEKDPNVQCPLKSWDIKLREARLTYELGVWFAKNPSRDISEIEVDSSSDYAVTTSRPGSEDMNIEREARERVAAMLHRSMGNSTEYDFSQNSMATDSFDAAGDGSGASGIKTPGLHNLRHPMQRNSTGGSSRNSRLSSFHQSTSAASHDEPPGTPTRNMYRAGSSVEHLIPPLNPDDAVTSITVNVVSESESETVVPPPQHQPQTHSQQPPKLGSRSPSTSNTLRVNPQTGVLALMHSLPDLTVDHTPPTQRHTHSPSPQSASEKLYQSHHELLQRNRLSAHSHQHYLSPDHRGTSYPPPSPTRAYLKRGLAFSYSFKNPPLSKMGHVNSQSQVQAETGTSATQQGQAQGAQGAQGEKGGHPTSVPVPSQGPSPEKADEKKKSAKHFISRNKSGSASNRGVAGSTGGSTAGSSRGTSSNSGGGGSGGGSVGNSGGASGGASGARGNSGSASGSGAAGSGGAGGGGRGNPRGTGGSGPASKSGDAGDDDRDHNKGNSAGNTGGTGGSGRGNVESTSGSGANGSSVDTGSSGTGNSGALASSEGTSGSAGGDRRVKAGTSTGPSRCRGAIPERIEMVQVTLSSNGLPDINGAASNGSVATSGFDRAYDEPGPSGLCNFNQAYKDRISLSGSSESPDPKSAASPNSSATGASSMSSRESGTSVLEGRGSSGIGSSVISLAPEEPAMGYARAARAMGNPSDRATSSGASGSSGVVGPGGVRFRDMLRRPRAIPPGESSDTTTSSHGSDYDEIHAD